MTTLHRPYANGEGPAGVGMTTLHRPIKVFLSKVTVRVSGQPLDMLRYDRCCPATEADAGKLFRVLRGDTSPPTAEDHVITFLRWSHVPGGPTVDRWASFNCEILSWEAM